MRLDEINKYKNVPVFCDLDGVLADFERGVKEMSGKPMHKWEPSVIWKAMEDLEHEGEGFYEWIQPMQDAMVLWNHIKPMRPTILTGIPRGTWAAPQKRNWVKKHLGNPPIITCNSWEKHSKAMEHMGTDNLQGAILIDDRIKAAEAWTGAGGTFVHHRNAAKSIQDLG